MMPYQSSETVNAAVAIDAVTAVVRTIRVEPECFSCFLALAAWYLMRVAFPVVVSKQVNFRCSLNSRLDSFDT